MRVLILLALISCEREPKAPETQPVRAGGQSTDETIPISWTGILPSLPLSLSSTTPNLNIKMPWHTDPNDQLAGLRELASDNKKVELCVIVDGKRYTCSTLEGMHKPGAP